MILILISVTQSYNTCSRCILKKFHVILSTCEVIAFLVLLSQLKKNNRDFARISGYYLAINKFGFRRYEELSRSRRARSELLNSSYSTKAEFINCFIIHSK